MKRNGSPSMFSVSSMTSRVVPAMSDTKALSSFSKAFSRVDLPTFGAPAMATGIPFLTELPSAKEDINRVIFRRRPCQYFEQLFPIGKLHVFFAEVQFQLE